MSLLCAGHKLVSSLFAKYDKTCSTALKMALVSRICIELTMHAGIEEEIFYPAVKKALTDKDLVHKALVEHATLKELIGQVQGVEHDGEMFNARIRMLSEHVKHHVNAEQNEIFPSMRGWRGRAMINCAVRYFQLDISQQSRPTGTGRT